MKSDTHISAATVQQGEGYIAIYGIFNIIGKFDECM